MDEAQPFDQMIIERTKAWAAEYDMAARQRLADGVTMTMRNRNDYFGYFYNRSTNSQWRPYTGKGMVTYPIIGRSVRAKTATACATKVQVEIEPVRSVPEKAAACDMAKNIVKFCREKLWNKQVEATLAEFGQLHRFSFLYNTYQEHGGVVIDIPEKVEKVVKTGDTVYTCHNCGLQYGPNDLGIDDFADEFKDKDLEDGEMEDQPMQRSDGEEPTAAPDEEQAEDPNVPEDESAEIEGEPVDPDDEVGRTMDHTAGLTCPECQTNTLVMDSRAKHEKITALTGKYQRKDCGFMDTQVISPLLIRFDAYSSIGFQYKRAGWFNYHPLVPAYELLAMAPHLKEKLQYGRGQWSESARWHYDLNNSSSDAAGYTYRGKSYQLDDLVEINCWWVSPNACVGWNSPGEWSLPMFEFTPEGEVVQVEGESVNLMDGETIEAAVVRQFGEFKGLLVLIHGDEVIGLGNAHFTENWVGNGWKIDAQSAFPQGEENQLKLQDAATNVLGLYYSNVKRRAASTLVVDPRGGFDEKSIENAGQPGGTITRNPVSQTIADQNWQHFLGYLEPGELGAAVYNFIQLIIEIAKEESGIYNETVGNTENQETLGGRKIALSQSLSLMTPTQQNKGETLIEQTYVWLELWQKNAPDEAYQLIKGTFEEEWKPLDIQAFKDLDVRRELSATIVEGTDIPRTQTEMEQRYFAAVQMGMFIEPNPLPPQIRARIIKGVLGIDMDIGNYDANKRLAARRFEFMKQELSVVTPQEALTITMNPMGFPVRSLRPEIIASIAQDPRTAPRETDEHLVYIEFFTDQINGMSGADQPDEVMIAACEQMISMHRAFVAAKAAQGAAVQNIADQAGQPQPMLSPGAPPPNQLPTEAGVSAA